MANYWVDLLDGSQVWTVSDGWPEIPVSGGVLTNQDAGGTSSAGVKTLDIGTEGHTILSIDVDMEMAMSAQPGTWEIPSLSIESESYSTVLSIYLESLGGFVYGLTGEFPAESSSPIQSGSSANVRVGYPPSNLFPITTTVSRFRILMSDGVTPPADRDPINVITDPAMWSPNDGWDGAQWSFVSWGFFPALNLVGAIRDGDTIFASVSGTNDQGGNPLYLNVVEDGVVVASVETYAGGEVNVPVMHGRSYSLVWGYSSTMTAPSEVYGGELIISQPPSPPEETVSYNCECEGADATRKSATLSDLRRRVLIRMGYVANADNPPPGKAAEVDDYIRQAQEFLYGSVASFRQSRYYRWPLVEGVRFYGFDGNDDLCPKDMQPELVEWVGVSDGPVNGDRWRQLACGINPELYDSGVRNAWPTRYDFRQCIEVWPAPDARTGGYLRIKAKFAVGPLVADTDQVTIDPELVFMLALANMRSDYEKPGAEKYAKMVTQRIGEINAASHHTRRYHPSAGLPSRATDPVPADGWLP